VNKLYESMPNFASEQEEADWLDAHAEELDGHFGDAIASGTAMDRRQFSELMLREHDLIWPAARVSVYLSDEDIARQDQSRRLADLPRKSC
jgi:hypothetical protein